MSRSDGYAHTPLLVLMAVGMFGFAFALVPLYDVFCEITGINGKTSAQAALFEEIAADEQPIKREVTVEFIANVSRGAPLEFRPLQEKLTVQPGTMNTATYYVRNGSHMAVTSQAVPSVSPGQAAKYLKKIECFCFEQQELPADSEMELGVSFYIDADIPAAISELTLSYTMFPIGAVDHEHVAVNHDQGSNVRDE